MGIPDEGRGLGMRMSGRGIRVLVVVLALVSALLSGGCAKKAEQDLVGTWRTKLTGYNNVAAGITQYDQTVTFSADGTMVMDNTLPGDVNHVTGRYEITKLDGKAAVTITWDVPVDKPSVLYYGFQGDKLLMSRAPESLDLSTQLNVGNQEPIVYLRTQRAPAN
jgi:hypothetical protein